MQEAIEDVLTHEEVEEELDKKILNEFDRVVFRKFKEFGQQQVGGSKVRLQGECSSYNNCDDVWQFILKRCEIKCDYFHESSDNLKIIAMDQQNREGQPRKEQVKKAVVKRKPEEKGRRGGSNGFKPRGGRR